MLSVTRRTGVVLAVVGIPLVLATCSSKSSTAPPPPNGNVAILLGDHQPGLVGYGVNVRPAVLVTNGASTPVSNATVTFTVQSGGGSVTGGTVLTNAAGVAQVGKWTLGATAGVNTLTATATGAGIVGNTVTFTDTALAANQYTIQIQYFGPTPSATVQAAMNAAVARWQQLIYRAIGSIPINEPAGACLAGTPAINTTVSNLLIQAEFDSIDGPGKILGQAGPCLVRNTSGLTAVGVMEFDTADIATLISNGQLNEVMLHEMGHVIGFGTLWDNAPNNCLQLPDTIPGGAVHDTYFSCPKARAAFDSIGGTSYTGASLSPPGGNKIPVENCGASTINLESSVGCGASTVNGHWREPVFRSELMTGYIDPGVEPAQHREHRGPGGPGVHGELRRGGRVHARLYGAAGGRGRTAVPRRRHPPRPDLHGRPAGPGDRHAAALSPPEARRHATATGALAGGRRREYDFGSPSLTTPTDVERPWTR